MLTLQSAHTFLNTKICMFILFYCLQNLENKEIGGKLVSRWTTCQITSYFAFCGLERLMSSQPHNPRYGLIIESLRLEKTSQIIKSNCYTMQMPRSEMLLKGTEPQQGLLKTVTLLGNGLEIWPVILSQLVRHTVLQSVAEKRRL